MGKTLRPVFTCCVFKVSPESKEELCTLSSWIPSHWKARHCHNLTSCNHI